MAPENVGLSRQRFAVLLQRPWALLVPSIVLVVLCLLGLPSVQKDPSVDAFVPKNHPAALARDLANDTFGLEDPIVLGLSAKDGQSLFTEQGLRLLRDIDEQVRLLEGVKKNDVVSLSSENAIRGDNGDLIVEPIIPAGQIDDQTAATAWDRYTSMPMLEGLLSSTSGNLLTVIIPVEDPNNAQGTVTAIRELANTLTDDTIEVHLSGVATMNARLAEMVDTDTRIFVPAAIFVVLVVLFIALRRSSALLGPLFVIAGSAGIAIGTMGWLGAHYYLITTALPVVIMAIAVADSLHICTYYLRARANDPNCTATDAAIEALNRAWLPVTLTSITTVAAFIGLSFGAAMQPISEFGIFAAVGVAAACLLSLTSLPAILVLTNLRPSESRGTIARDGWVDRLVSRITLFSFQKPGQAIAGVAVLTGLLAVFALRAEFDYERQRYFTQAEAVRVSDQLINERLGGINFLDVIVTAPEPGGLMTPSALEAISELRAALGGLPLVAATSGIDEYVSLMHSVLTDAPEGSLPTLLRAPAQYMFLYESSAPPEDFKQEIDYDYTRALIRGQLSTDRYSATLPVVHDLNGLIADWQQRTGLDAVVSGRVAVNDGWMTQLSQTHFRGLGLAVVLVLLTTVLVFRSLRFGLFAMIPVCFGIASVYAAMGALAIDIAPATSMTAAIATGLGVDFGVHLISHVRKRLEAGASPLDAFSNTYTVVARACFYSAIALGVALSVVCLSSAPPLRWFGLLVSIGAFGSLVGALVIVPALWAVTSGAQSRSLSHAESH